MKTILYATTAIVALAIAVPAWAQQSPDATAPTASPAAEAAGDQGLADIVVTAQRREETAQRAAVAIDVISPAQLLNAGVVTTTMLNAAVPSLIVTRAGGATTSFFIRGVGNFTNNGYSDPATAFNVDGVYYGRPTSTTGTFYDLDRIEVLKGPQGTLYGRNATGGAINILPAKPRLGELSGYVSGGYGRFRAFDGEGAINVPLGEQFAFRLSGKAIDSRGFNRDGTGDEIGQGVRAQMLGELTPNLTVRVSGDYSHSGGIGVGASFNGRLAYTPGTAATATSPANYTYIPANLGVREGLTSPAATAYFSTVVIGGPQITPAPLNTPYQDNRFVGTSAEIVLKTDIGSLTVVPAYRNSRINNLFNGPAFRGGVNDEHDNQYSLEARFAGNRIGAFDWLIGGFYYDESIKGLYTFSQYTIQSYQDFTTSTKSSAAFGRVTLHLGEKARLVGGARYTHDDKAFSGQAITLVEICTRPVTGPTAACAGGPSVPVARNLADLAALIPASLLPAGLPPGPGAANARPFGSSGNLLFYTPTVVDTSLKKSRVTYRVAAEYDVAPRSLLYASYETGYRSGGFAPAAGHETYQPEYIEAITIGSKNRFLDNKLQLNIEAYRWTYRDQQVSHFGLDANGASNFFSENIGRSRIQGADVDLEYRALQNTLLRGSVQYLDNKLLSFTYLAPRGGTNLPPTVGCPFTNGLDSIGRQVYVVDCSGKSGFNAPKWSLNAGFDQTIPVGNLDLIATLDGRYRSNRVIGFEFIEQENSGSDVTADASLTLTDHDRRWAITGWVRNLTDKDVPVLAQFAGATGNAVVTTYQPPRTYGVRARFKF